MVPKLMRLFMSLKKVCVSNILLGEEVFMLANSLCTIRNLKSISEFWYYNYKSNKICLKKKD